MSEDLNQQGRDWRLEVLKDRINMVSASADRALVQLLVLNGGAAVAVLAFAERFAADGVAARALPKAADGLLTFAIGAGLAVVAMVLRFFAVLAEVYCISTEDDLKRSRFNLLAQVASLLSVSTVALGLAAFGVGVWTIRSAILALAS